MELVMTILCVYFLWVWISADGGVLNFLFENLLLFLEMLYGSLEMSGDWVNRVSINIVIIAGNGLSPISMSKLGLQVISLAGIGLISLIAGVVGHIVYWILVQVRFLVSVVLDELAVFMAEAAGLFKVLY